MRIFDEVDARALEHREFHLWLLATGMILILAAGMVLLMYPAIFSHPVVLSGQGHRTIFFGFCALSFLVVGYLIERQWVIRRLRKVLREEQTRTTRLRQQASADLLETLPGLSHFQDRLVMDIRRATTTQQPLSLLTVSLSSSNTLSGPGEVSIAFGDAAKALVRRLRREDSIYMFHPGAFGILLPGMSGNDAYRVADRIVDSLHDVSGASDRFSSEVRVVNYPEHVEGAREMELMALAGLPEHLQEPRPGSEETDSGQA